LALDVRFGDRLLAVVVAAAAKGGGDQVRKKVQPVR
jgi:hypothetical protein